ncbi:hypothetical protein M434DRAFT_233416 [Hypoxylon sp. CO27-5]|nr:hypothetical protein M434DRAFT_233416 [Hypoxylon sp. CO27-5]
MPPWLDLGAYCARRLPRLGTCGILSKGITHLSDGFGRMTDFGIGADLVSS